MKRAILVAFLLSSCAQTYTPVVDLKGVDKIRYEADLAECSQYGEEVKPTNDPVLTAILLIASFAALGAITGAVNDDSSVAEDAGLLAALGGGLGAAGVAGAEAEVANKQAQVIRNCLEGRGYKVLDQA